MSDRPFVPPSTPAPAVPGSARPGRAVVLGAALLLVGVLGALAPVLGVVRAADGSPVGASGLGGWVAVLPGLLVLALARPVPAAALAAAAGAGLLGVTRLVADLPLLTGPDDLVRPELFAETTDRARPFTAGAGAWLVLLADGLAVVVGVLAARALAAVPLPERATVAESGKPESAGALSTVSTVSTVSSVSTVSTVSSVSTVCTVGTAGHPPTGAGQQVSAVPPADGPTPPVGFGNRVRTGDGVPDAAARGATDGFGGGDGPPPLRLAGNASMIAVGWLGTVLVAAGALSVPYRGGYLDLRLVPAAADLSGVLTSVVLLLGLAVAVLVAAGLPRAWSAGLLGGAGLAAALPGLIAVAAVAAGAPTELSPSAFLTVVGGGSVAASAALTRFRGAAPTLPAGDPDDGPAVPGHRRQRVGDEDDRHAGTTVRPADGAAAADAADVASAPVAGTTMVRAKRRERDRVGAARAGDQGRPTGRPDRRGAMAGTGEQRAGRAPHPAGPASAETVSSVPPVSPVSSVGSVGSVVVGVLLLTAAAGCLLAWRRPILLFDGAAPPPEVADVAAPAAPPFLLAGIVLAVAGALTLVPRTAAAGRTAAGVLWAGALLAVTDAGAVLSRLTTAAGNARDPLSALMAVIPDESKHTWSAGPGMWAGIIGVTSAVAAALLAPTVTRRIDARSLLAPDDDAADGSRGARRIPVVVLVVLVVLAGALPVWTATLTRSTSLIRGYELGSLGVGAVTVAAVGAVLLAGWTLRPAVAAAAPVAAGVVLAQRCLVPAGVRIQDGFAYGPGLVVGVVAVAALFAAAPVFRHLAHRVAMVDIGDPGNRPGAPISDR